MTCTCRPFAPDLDCVVHPSRLRARQADLLAGAFLLMLAARVSHWLRSATIDSNRDHGDESDHA